MEPKNGCLVCGKDLQYYENATDLVCHICGVASRANAQCIEGHFVCDACHSLDALDYIEKFCTNSPAKNPLDLAITLMKHDSIMMHGPEHHFLVPAVLLTAYYNVLNDKESKVKKLAVARKRAESVLGGVCGFHGSCGAGVGTGIFMSLITNATPISKNEWKLANLMTSKSLLTISDHGGPRCCKRNTFLAVSAATQFLKETFAVDLETPESVQCAFYKNNKECLFKDCPYFRRSPLA